MDTYRDALLARQHHEERLRIVMQAHAVRRALHEAEYAPVPPSPPRTMQRLTRIVFWFVGINALLGAAALLFFPSATDRLFFWTIAPPVNATLFGALYLVGGIAVIACARNGDWGRARVLIPILVSAGLLISAVTLVHRASFTPGLRLSYWLSVYLGAPLLALLISWRQERRAPPQPIGQPLAPPTRWLAAGAGAALLGGGLALLIWPAPAIAVWPWPLGLLMLRIFAAWFSAFGVGLLWFLVEADWERLALLPTMLIGAAGLELGVLFLYRQEFSAGRSLGVYVAHLIGLGLLGATLHLVQRRTVATAERTGALHLNSAGERHPAG